MFFYFDFRFFNRTEAILEGSGIAVAPLKRAKATTAHSTPLPSLPKSSRIRQANNTQCVTPAIKTKKKSLETSNDETGNEETSTSDDETSGGSSNTTTSGTTTDDNGTDSNNDNANTNTRTNSCDNEDDDPDGSTSEDDNDDDANNAVNTPIAADSNQAPEGLGHVIRYIIVFNNLSL
jgi:hypothetical protein